MAENPWKPAFELFFYKLTKAKWILAGCAAAGCLAGATLKAYLPTTYYATAQLLFDPQGLKIFNNAITSGYLDANAAINYVESQMVVIRSERVLSRVLESKCAEKQKSSGPNGAQLVNTETFLPFMKLCPEPGPKADWSKAMQVLQRSFFVKRTERSFVVDVTATAPSPAAAAHFAGTIVQAYTDEDAANRARASQQLTNDLGARLDALRKTLADSETKLDQYSRNKDLLRVDGKLLAEQKLVAATTALNDAQMRVDRAGARVKQLASTPQSPGSMGALGTETDARTLLALVERRNALQVEVATLTPRAGARHPALVEARSRLSQANAAIGGEMATIRRAAQADLVRANAELAALAQTVASLSNTVTKAHQAEIDSRALQQQVDANRKMVESFETRTREAAEFGKIDSGNLRLVSVARAPVLTSQLPKLVLFGLVGLVLGILLALGGVALLALLDLIRAPEEERIPSDAELLRLAAEAMRMRAQTAAQYRYG